jgi:hypothetical protein
MMDSKILFASLDLPMNPLRPNVVWPTPQVNQVKRIDADAITDEMQTIIRDLGLTVDVLLLWTWNPVPNDEIYHIHTDGHYTNNPRHVAINWLIEGNSAVEWFSRAGAKPNLIFKQNVFPVTEWNYTESTPQLIGSWQGQRPALLSIQQPHRVRVISQNTPRRSITMRFLPNLNIDNMIEKLGKRVIKINEEY